MVTLTEGNARVCAIKKSFLDYCIRLVLIMILLISIQWSYTTVTNILKLKLLARVTSDFFKFLHHILNVLAFFPKCNASLYIIAWPLVLIFGHVTLLLHILLKQMFNLKKSLYTIFWMHKLFLTIYQFFIAIQYLLVQCKMHDGSPFISTIIIFKKSGDPQMIFWGDYISFWFQKEIERKNLLVSWIGWHRYQTKVVNYDFRGWECL